MRTPPGIGLVAALAMVPATFTPSSAAVVDVDPQDVAQCTAQVDQETRAALGAPALRVVVTLSESIGDVQEFRAAQGSGLTLADPAALPPVSRTGGPLQMMAEDVVVVWINTEDAAAGVHEFTLRGESGECSGQLEVMTGS
ncbi:MAG: hypothetical protein RQ745_10105 [Longimicrobiales bacterium]|nr:hypothetical protein [Longimicrobiales bacterium]